MLVICNLLKSKLVLLISILLLSCGFTLAQPVLMPKLKEQKKEHKNDWVILDNGDRITGEIKKMQYGILYLKSVRAVGTLQLDWTRIQRIQSDGRYEFEINNGKQYIGVIVPDPDMRIPSGFLALQLANGSSLQFKILEIVGIREMQENFLGRLSLSLDAGITFTKGNQQRQTNVNTILEYSRPRYSLRLDVQSLFSGQSNGTSTSRHSALLFAERFLTPKWGMIGLLGFLHDNQLDLDLRSTIGGAFRRTFVKTNRTRITGFIGSVYTKENYLSGTDRNNGEAVTGLSISTYRFRSSELNAYGFVFPSFTDFGRVRADTSAYWKWEIVRDLYWKVSVFDNFDSHPPASAPKNNFGASSSVGWSF